MKEKVAIVSVSVLGLAMAAWLGGSLLAANRVQEVLQGMQEPSLWLTEVLSELPYAQTADDYDRLLPWNIHPKDLAINPVFVSSKLTRPWLSFQPARTAGDWGW